MEENYKYFFLIKEHETEPVIKSISCYFNPFWKG